MNTETKQRIEKVTKFLESCWDENQEQDDDLTFDERVRVRMDELSEEDKEIVRDAISWS